MSWVKQYRESRVLGYSSEARAGQQAIWQFLLASDSFLNILGRRKEITPDETKKQEMILGAYVILTWLGKGQLTTQPRKPYRISKQLGFSEEDATTILKAAVCDLRALAAEKVATPDGQQLFAHAADKLESLINSPNFSVLMHEHAERERAFAGRTTMHL